MKKFDLLRQIKPKEDRYSDKYSWQLYQFVKRNGCTKVYYNLREDETYDWKAPRWNRIYICKDMQGDIVGNELISIQLPSSGKYKLHCYCESNGYNLMDITDNFWDMYIKDGRCVLDRSHAGWWSGSGDKFLNLDENTRQCKWCGKKFIRQTYTETVEKERWVEK